MGSTVLPTSAISVSIVFILSYDKFDGLLFNLVVDIELLELGDDKRAGWSSKGLFKFVVLFGKRSAQLQLVSYVENRKSNFIIRFQGVRRAEMFVEGLSGCRSGAQII